jgi:DNA ligase 1
MTSFGQLVACSHAVGATASRLAKRKLLADLLQSCQAHELPIVIGVLCGEPRQGRIGVGWASVAALSSPHDEHDEHDEHHGRNEFSNSDPLGRTVDELDELIDLLASTEGPGSQAIRQQALSAFAQHCSEEQITFLQQLFTGGIRHGALIGVMVEAVADALEVPAKLLRNGLMIRGNLGELAGEIAEHGSAVLDTMSILIGQPMQPMLAATSASLTEALGELGRSSVEFKLDGARLQIHLQAHADGRKEIHLFTRNLNDITSRLPDVVRVLSTIKATSLVADAEVLGLDADGAPAVFQETMSRVGSDEAKQHHSVTLRPFLFDLMHLNGHDLLDTPLEERLQKLREIAPELMVPSIITEDFDAALQLQEQALRDGHEGVMVKSSASHYEAGRRGKTWRKVKPVRTLDLVVLAAEWGHGRRTGKLSNLHLGAQAMNQQTELATELATEPFIMVGKTFKGLTDELLAWQTVALLTAETHRVGITVFVKPSLVVEIALDGVQRSSRYPGGVALRFARVKRYRPDKQPTDADTIETVRSLLLGAQQGEAAAAVPTIDEQN